MGTGGMRLGAGRPGWRRKVEHCLQLDVTRLARQGVLQAGARVGWSWTNTYTGEEMGSIGIKAEGGGLTLGYHLDGKPTRQAIAIERTPCHFGGTRAWLGCPRCARRVGMLYLNGGAFVCRQCARLAYGSQSDNLIGRTWRRQRRLERLLGDDLERPKGMHHRTHGRIVQGILQCWHERDAAFAVVVHRLNNRLAMLGHKFSLDL